LHRPLQARGDRARARVHGLARIACQHAHGDGVLVIDEAARAELAVAREQVDQCAGRLGHGASAERVTEHPGVSRAHAPRHVVGQAVLAVADRDPGGTARRRAGAATIHGGIT
jgi:hypothetical protein